MRLLPKPSMSTCVPLPPERVMETPGRRCRDSATFWSGILPMSSATTDSIGWTEMRLASSADCSDWRKPVTTISMRSSGALAFCEVVEAGGAGACCAAAGAQLNIAGSVVAVIIAARAARRARFWTRCDINFSIPLESYTNTGVTFGARLSEVVHGLTIRTSEGLPLHIARFHTAELMWDGD